MPGLVQVNGTAITATSVSAGTEHSCVITTERELLTFGSNSSYQLGRERAPGQLFEDEPSSVDEVSSRQTHADAVHCGENHTIVIVHQVSARDLGPTWD